MAAVDFIDAGTSALIAMPAPRSPLPRGAAAVNLAAPAEGESGVEIALSPLQLAAILEGETLDSQPSSWNWFWGALTAAGGGIEIAVGAGLLAAPEPTTLTKFAGAALVGHGADTAAAGVNQIASGHSVSTLTSQAASALAAKFGATDSQAQAIGVTLDIAVPLLAGFVGAARALAIRRGTVVLAAEEAAGGHTILKHVGRTEAQLAQRLANERHLRAASTFHTLRAAEQVIGEALRANKATIAEWAKTASPGARKLFVHTSNRTVGDVLLRATGHLQSTAKLQMMLVKVQQSDRVYFVLTAYPSL